VGSGEARLQAEIVKWIEDNGGYVRKYPQNQATRAGTPDLLICWRGRFFGVEVKHPTKKTPYRPLQQDNLRWIEDAGGMSFTVGHGYLEWPRFREFLLNVNWV